MREVGKVTENAPYSTHKAPQFIFLINQATDMPHLNHSKMWKFNLHIVYLSKTVNHRIVHVIVPLGYIDHFTLHFKM